MARSQGRLFGRLNLFDAAVLLLIAGLIPLGYASWVIFRTPPAAISAIEPASATATRDLPVRLRGVNLRPYMRASLGHHQGANFFFRDSTHADVLFRNVPAGTYDLILYDNEKELFRLQSAMVIAPSPLPESRVLVIGTLGGLTPEQSRQVKAGTPIPEFGEIVEVAAEMVSATRVRSGAATVQVRDEAASRLPVAIRVGCFIRSLEGLAVCSVGDVDLKGGVLLRLQTPWGALPFQVDQLQSTAPLADIRMTVRFVNDPRVVSQIAVGDTDAGEASNPLLPRATVLSVTSTRADIREVSIRVQAQRESDGWYYSSAPLRIGGPFSLRTLLYQVAGEVVALDAPAGEPSR